MSDRDDSGAPRLRVDRLAAAMDAARARARAAAEIPAPQTAAAAPTAGPEKAPPAEPAGRIGPGPARVETAVGPAMPGPSSPPDPVPEPDDLVDSGCDAAPHDRAKDPRAVGRARSERLLLTEDFRIADAHPAMAPDTVAAPDATAPENAHGATVPATIVVPVAVPPLIPPRVDAALAPALLSLSGVATHIGRTRILQDVTFDVPKRAVTMLLGRNGAGKTTTLRTVMGLWRARAGDIVLSGDRIDRWPSHRIARAGVGYVPEAMSIFTDLTVAENISLGARSGPVPRDRLDWLTGLFPPLATLWRSPAGNLSRGEKQMLALARALVEKRRLYLIDEPTRGLAPAIVDTVVAALRDLKLQGATILMVERNVALARALGDACVVMDAGRVTWRGTMADLDRDPALQTRLLGRTLGDAA